MSTYEGLQRSALVGEVLQEMTVLRQKSFCGEIESLREDLEKKLRMLYDASFELGVTKEELAYMQYFLVAGLDEAAIAYGGAIMSLWMKGTLQFRCYGSNIAGQHFFEKLNIVQEESEKYPLALYTAYRVLSSGFLGKYFSDKALREELIEQCARQLVRLHANLITHKEIGIYRKPVRSLEFKRWMYAVAFFIVVFVTWISNRIVSNITIHQAIIASQSSLGGTQ